MTGKAYSLFDYFDKATADLLKISLEDYIDIIDHKLTLEEYDLFCKTFEEETNKRLWVKSRQIFRKYVDEKNK